MGKGKQWRYESFSKGKQSRDENERKKETKFSFETERSKELCGFLKNSKEILGCSQKKKFFGLITFENRDHERKVIGGTELIMEESWGTQGIGNGGDFFSLGIEKNNFELLWWDQVWSAALVVFIAAECRV